MEIMLFVTFLVLFILFAVYLYGVWYLSRILVNGGYRWGESIWHSLNWPFRHLRGER